MIYLCMHILRHVTISLVSMYVHSSEMYFLHVLFVVKHTIKNSEFSKHILGYPNCHLNNTPWKGVVVLPIGCHSTPHKVIY